MNGLIIQPVAIFSGGVWQIIGQTSLFGIIILIILVVFSLVSWAIIFNKWRLFRKVEDENWTFLNYFQKTRRLDDLVGQAKSLRRTPLAGIYLEGYEEIKSLLEGKQPGNPEQDSKLTLNKDDIETVEMTLERARAEEIGELEKSVVFLATTANASPFLGLLGTVVGVMDAFWSIGQRGSASLAVVAPGIAEALLATIVGLGAAIPAVIGFNWANNKLKYFNDRAANFSLDFLVRVKKDMVK